jgi:2-polyprenyl-6-methoxyphenol hydroxylase-like FAD-dependent oxidoreductase
MIRFSEARSAREAGSGYMLALMPLVDPVLEALGVLGSGGGAVTYGATVTALRRRPAAVLATLDDGSARTEAEFDLVIAADGLHSATRGLVLGPDQVGTYDSGWGGWVAWAEPDADVDLADELWGAGVFVGTYPVKGRLGVIVAGPRSDTAAGTERFVARVRGRSGPAGSRIERALDVVARHPDAYYAYYWSLTDCRSQAWSVGRVALLGDAAAGFLPTAGIGAAMAMESAWVLAGLLPGATPDQVPEVLGRYERARLAIDDFGTGYSSLSYLHRFPVDILKIDRSFVERLSHASDNAELARTIVHLGQSLQLVTVAEGVEDSAQFLALRRMGCDVGQGYYFGRPMESEAMERLLGEELTAAKTPAAAD